MVVYYNINKIPVGLHSKLSEISESFFCFNGLLKFYLWNLKK